jgi:energy-coupling factor transport system substrate-specific component
VWKLSVKTVVAIGIGAAIFIVLGMFGSIPTGIPNTNLDTSYGLLSMLAAVFGPIAGLLIGLIGHALKDTFLYGSMWWSWIICSAVEGFLIGLFVTKFGVEDGKFGLKQAILFNVVQILSNAVCWFGLAPVLDIVIYSEPANKVFTQGLVAGAANMVVMLVLGTALLFGYSATRQKASSLAKEE